MKKGKRSIDKRNMRRLCRLSCWLLLGVVVFALATRDWKLISDRHENRYLVRELGLLGYLIYDTGSIAKAFVEKRRLESLDVAPYADFLAERTASRGNSSDKDPKRKNVIFLQLESVDGFCLWEDFEGEPLMPRLREIASEGVAFRNTMDVTHAGRTVDAELLVLTSLVPVRGNPVFVNYSLDRVPSMPRILNEQGYYSFSAHGFDGSFWNRAKAHRALGFEEDFFLPDIPHTDIIGWGVSDEDTLKFALEKIRSSAEPVFAHIILLTHHHPYDHVGNKFGRKTDSQEGDFIVSLRYVDAQVGLFYDQLQDSGELENTILAIYSDHDSGMTYPLATYLGADLKPLSDTVPLIVLGLEEDPRVETRVTGLQDLPVMVLDELGLPLPSTFQGNSLETVGRTISHDGKVWQLKGADIVTEPLSIDVKTLTKLSLIRPDDLEEAN